MTEGALLRRTERLRKRPDDSVARGLNLADPEAVHLSWRMDRLVIEYLQMTEGRELPSLTHHDDESV